MPWLWDALAGLTGLSGVLLLWQWLAARRFALHLRTSSGDFAPPISLLKPLKGCDATTAASLETWLLQQYPGPVEVLFGVAAASDPVCEVVREVLGRHPHFPARLVICHNLAGANAKVAKLAQLEALARHELILISDADVRVPPDFLSQFVLPLREPATALVNCFYRLANPTTLAMQWEAVAVNADFWSQVLQARSLQPLDFALGAAVLVRRPALAQIGGFTALANCLADDFQLGRRLARRGYRIALCPVVVECWDAPQTWRQVWKHQLRWARTIRVCQPWPYGFSLLANATLWPLLWVFAAAVVGHLPAAALGATPCILARMVLAWDLQRRMTSSLPSASPFWLTPLKDLLQSGLWLAAFLGNTVEWRGRTLTVRRDGTLVEAPPP